MRKKTLFAAVLAMLTAGLLYAAPAFAGSPHPVGSFEVTRSGDNLTVSGKVAGLGNEDDITVTVTADAQCVNPGSQEPQAENKGAVLATAVVPVQNGKADFSLTGSAQTDPRCNPPMTLVYQNVTVTVSDDEAPFTFEPFSINLGTF
jgi:hypothetical protein